jgi:DNA-cytosine methyltransferase
VDEKIKVAELFAGVGGFRLGLEGYNDPERGWDLPSAGPYKTVWANQWEPGTDRKQFAARCYAERFGKGSVVNEDIDTVLDQYEAGERDIPDVDMVVGGFPCQDYSVARPLSQATGIEGKKGVLWWSIFRFLNIQLAKSPDNARYCMFENVDRLLKSPARQRGRDFAIILSCLATLGYSVEWRVVNSAEYGFPQRRKRIYIYAERNACWGATEHLTRGVMATAFPMNPPKQVDRVNIPLDPYEASQSFNQGGKATPFSDAGVMVGSEAVTCRVVERYDGPRMTLGDVLIPEDEVPSEYFVPESQREKWEYLKGSKREKRVNKATGFEYSYSEGAMAFPDAVDRPSRTILTGEGGRGASRFKHVIECSDGRLRRLVPDELDQLQCFPRGWTDTGMTDGQRAFCMGNALVVGIPHAIGKVIASSSSADV